MKTPDWQTVLRVAWQETSRVALISLLVTNAIPLIGVLLGRWSLFSVMFLYWAENGVIGVFNAVKIVMAQGSPRPSLPARLSLALFFCFHYGIFWLVHGVFVIVLFGGTAGGAPFTGASGSPFIVKRGGPFAAMGRLNFTTLEAGARAFPGGLWGVLGMLVISHGVSFVNNFVGRNEYQRISAQEQMMQPYQRVVMLHVTVLAGGFVVLLLGQPTLALVLLILLKTGADLRAHVIEHLSAQKTIPPPVGPFER